MADDLHTTARAMRQQLLGKDFAAKLDKKVYTDPMMDKFAEVARQIAFGTVWTRPGLDLKTRTMITLVSDATNGRHDELELHVRMARNQGWTEDEITEALLHLAAYVGLPLCREAMLCAKGVFEEMRKEAKPARRATAKRAAGRRKGS
jgi:4-carboxymuconolactone decarboxylase